MTSLKFERAYHALAFVETVGKLYSIGGEPNSFAKVSDKVYAYSFSSGLTGTWTELGEKFLKHFINFPLPTSSINKVSTDRLVSDLIFF